MAVSGFVLSTPRAGVSVTVSSTSPLRYVSAIGAPLPDVTNSRNDSGVGVASVSSPRAAERIVALIGKSSAGLPGTAPRINSGAPGVALSDPTRTSVPTMRIATRITQANKTFIVTPAISTTACAHFGLALKVRD